MAANKMAMSRALGAAFLNHQVEQLEKSVSNGPASVNWRDRRNGSPNPSARVPPIAAKRLAAPTKSANRRKGGEIQIVPRGRDVPQQDANVARDIAFRRRSSEEKEEKDADIVVADASVLVHALHQVKKWCRDGREEVVIVPLEGQSHSPLVGSMILIYFE